MIRNGIQIQTGIIYILDAILTPMGMKIDDQK